MCPPLSGVEKRQYRLDFMKEHLPLEPDIEIRLVSS